MSRLTIMIVFTLLMYTCLNAQVREIQTQKKYQIGVFVPVHLDSVFKGNTYRYGKKFPRFTLQGLEFIQGAEIALDSFPSNGPLIETFIYDCKSDSLSIDSLIAHHKLDSLNLLIGAVKDEELTSLAAFSKVHKIPFISVTYPNDGGVKENPYYFILNPTLKTHCESIFSFIFQNYSSDHILLARKSGNQEDRVESYFNSINQQDNARLLKVTSILVDSNINLIIEKLDSTKNNIIIGGSLDEEFAKNLVSTLKNASSKYQITLIGMPNWSGFSSFGKNIKNGLKDFPFYFTSPFYNEKNDSVSKVIQNAYIKKYKGYPGDFAYKGFETIYYFSRLIRDNVNDFFENINNENSNTFSRFNFLPVYNSTQNNIVDYYENKHLFILEKKNGKTSKIDL